MKISISMAKKNFQNTQLNALKIFKHGNVLDLDIYLKSTCSLNKNCSVIIFNLLLVIISFLSQND